MVRTLGIGIAGSCLVVALAWPAVTAVAAPKKAPQTAATKDGWPNTREGAVARRWVEAFSKGEKAMRTVLPDLLAPESLAKTSMDKRMERYRGLQDRFGALMLVKIDKEAPGELTAVLAGSDLTQVPFTFKVQTEAPYKLVSVSFADQRHMHGGGFSH